MVSPALFCSEEKQIDRCLYSSLLNLYIVNTKEVKEEGNGCHKWKNNPWTGVKCLQGVPAVMERKAESGKTNYVFA